MKPVSPVCTDPVLCNGAKEVVYAKDQPEYIPLPVLKFDDGYVVTRWQLSWKERLHIMLGGSVFLGVLTFNKPLQPVKITTDVREVLS